MARIWRDGQRNNVTIYRLLTTGTIEERIYQRQLTKVALSDSVIDNVQSTKNSFSQDELRDIFSLDTNTDCGTHEMLGCSCLGMGESDFNLDTKQTDQDGSDNECDPSDETWKHFGPLHMNACKNTDDGVLETVLSKSDGMVSYVFKK
ncbi:hypothetical protein BDEG_24302 [Batrachochytrium dendrobatidis JEL423]|uniref:SNF2 N-terminal domain-containing protein n=1 Tax=Batrachochytrium dendrobatidis (strain JEL423) TaxID=403673 RepID=A0A177WLL3_BATDL|nr:hypothetical protein BDEG_24302 [Batrachochytrium dendrobatidis JEL423]